MAPLTWDDLAEQAWQLEAAGRFAEALALITPYKALFPSQWLYYHSQLRCAAHVGAEPTLTVLRTALEDGYWFDEAGLQRESALAPLLAMPAFAELLAISNERRRQAQATAAPMLLTVQPRDTPAPYPALLALHGAGSSIAGSLQPWQSVVQHGWLLALPQSSQVGDAEGYVWNDQERASNEIVRHIAAVQAGYPVDTRRFVVGGFSMGAGLALQLALSRTVGAVGFFAVAPYVGDIDSIVKQVKTEQSQQLRGYIVVGQEDEGCLQIAQELGKQLPMHGVACEVEIHPQVGHWFPMDFAQSLERGLAFITQ